MDWNKTLNWKLLKGSHKFPGPDGGTCINEAAIVAAGFEYNSVKSADDCPPCFSRVLSTYAIILNDDLPDELRQMLLMPFITRLAGTADTPEIEWQRYDCIILGLFRSVLPIALRGWKDKLATEYERVTDYEKAIVVVDNIYHDIYHEFSHAISRAIFRAHDLVKYLTSHGSYLLPPYDYSLDLVHAFVGDLANQSYRNHDLDFCTAKVALLESAMKIGKQAEPIEQALVIDRLAKIRQPQLTE